MMLSLLTKHLDLVHSFISVQFFHYTLSLEGTIFALYSYVFKRKHKINLLGSALNLPGMLESWAMTAKCSTFFSNGKSSIT